ncbi:MAG: arylsulfatase [Bacteroidales bacterium]|nr:arylsulfatase [Bacteroidales bacterium]MDD2205366.1 arylsulfatase [Bacteroidales bacterium]MDD3914773.1 arylsulfatase [Bacteroidales bacterium]MDD4634200.1 arylsulfatase [Bacteroidales bacterium]
MNNKINILLGALSLPVICEVMPACSSNHKQQLPNVVFILADDLGYGDLGCYGQTKIETPNIDKLASMGIKFTDHYCGSPVSAPSRCCLMTGLNTGHSYIRGNDEVSSRGNVWSHEAMLNDSTLEGQRPMLLNTVTMPKLMQEAGYTTACIGKWGLGYPGSESTPNKMGFDYFYGYNCQRQAHTYFPPFLYENEHRVYLNNEFLPPHTGLDKDADVNNPDNYAKFWQKDYSCDLCFNKIIDFIDANNENPFFLMWTSIVPHLPLQAPEKWVKHYVEKFGAEQPYTGNSGYFPCYYPHATYAAMISYFDEQIGQLINYLEENNLIENTIIVFTSDNGPTFAAGGADSPWFDSAKPFKSEYGWGKASLHEGGIRVPLIVRWDKKIPENASTSLMCASWDFMATFCDVANVVPPQNDGISFLPTLVGKGDEQLKHDALYWEFPESNGSKVVRSGKWKLYIDNVKNGNSKYQLFDLETDGREQNDVADKYPNVVEKLKLIIQESHSKAEIEKFNF